MGSPLSIKFWGTRGLVSSPRKGTAQYGGNTTCMQVLYKEHLIIVDTGFGVSNLGEILMQRILTGREKLEIHIFYTHYHWDHIQGLPFFHPIYFPTSVLHLHSPLAPDVAAENLDPLFDGSYSPFSGIHSMPSKINFHRLEKAIAIDGLEISYTPLDHITSASPTYAYRISVPGGPSLVIATDHEARPSPVNDSLVKFAAGADLLIHDAQFTEAEYKNHEGWGHSTIEQALHNALACKARKTLLTHHHPSRNDAELMTLLASLRKQAAFRKLAFDFAQEGIVYEL